MFDPDKDGIYASLEASPMRRIFACSILFFLGAMVIYVAIQPPFKVVLTPVLLVMGIGTVMIGDKLRRVTLRAIHLTEDDLRDSDGRVLVNLADVVRVERGAFAFKPSNGFMLVLDHKKPFSWAPGLWWRIGAKLGVGGVTGAGQAKYMAEQIALRIAIRDQD